MAVEIAPIGIPQGQPPLCTTSAATTADTSQPNTGENGAGSPGSTGSTVSANPSSGEGLMQQCADPN